MSENIWDEVRLLRYINDEIEESLNLDYKAAGSLDKRPEKKTEISKDVSAMANSAGGIIIYGLSEYQNKAKSHLAEKLSPIDRTQYSKEWLEQIINSNIRPKIDGIIIHSIQLNSGADDVAYVVEIPASTTAHQATDKKYYKRYNFESIAMEDYEIRDVMGRNQYPKIELEFKIEISTVNVNSAYWNIGMDKSPEYRDIFKIRARATNIGNTYAQYIQAFFVIPSDFLPTYHDRISGSDGAPKQYISYYKNQIAQYTFTIDNMVKDYLGKSPMDSAYIKRYEPLLPKLSRWLSTEQLSNDFEKLDIEDLIIEWITYADNAPPNRGIVLGKDIAIIDSRQKEE